jgi:methionyl-tRNA formyltransferase
LRVAFAGTPEFALPALAALAAQHELVGILTQPDRPAGRGRKLAASAVKEAALLRGLPLAQPPTLRSADGRAALEAWAPEALVVVAYGLLLPPAVLQLPHHGCLNIHASLLPRWRGAAPIQRAILAGDAQSGVTIMRMNAGLDTGPMLLRRALPIGEQDTGGSLHDALATLGAAAIIEVLDALERGPVTGEVQPEAGVTYAAKIQKSEAAIDWGQDALAIERQVRAFNPWPIAQTQLDGQQLRVHAARIVDEKEAIGLPFSDKSAEKGSIVAVRDDFFLVRCGRGILAICEVHEPGRRPVSARDFSHSHALLGRRLG